MRQSEIPRTPWLIFKKKALTVRRARRVWLPFSAFSLLLDLIIMATYRKIKYERACPICGSTNGIHSHGPEALWEKISIFPIFSPNIYIS